MSKLPWFKHYNTASDGNSLRLFWDSGDFESYAFYWKFLEIVSRLEDRNNRGKVTLSWSLLRREVGWNRQRLSKVWSKIVQSFKLEVTPISDETWEVFVPNWLELQQTAGTYDRHKKGMMSGEERREKREGRRESKEDQQPEPFLKKEKHKQPTREVVEWPALKPEIKFEIAALGYSDEFFERQWLRLLAYDAHSPYKNRKAAAVNWFTGRYCKRDWAAESQDHVGDGTFEDAIRNLEEAIR